MITLFITVTEWSSFWNVRKIHLSENLNLDPQAAVYTLKSQWLFQAFTGPGFMITV